MPFRPSGSLTSRGVLLYHRQILGQLSMKVRIQCAARPGAVFRGSASCRHRTMRASGARARRDVVHNDLTVTRPFVMPIESEELTGVQLEVGVIAPLARPKLIRVEAEVVIRCVRSIAVALCILTAVFRERETI